ncbi:DUF4118 domain-containing protein [Dictyobacter arantiisoli]|uniref:Sensor protein KdpD transmembrane domain-containing protein n=1 Tax=Dictyobacter arantiisoli TaxID=2014874 RepID=A0A5A5TJY0_9CHLR|nr:DUF4118 domain-containing protein [Dictyobacter arantiisoli]GCF11747.1 hypothetical protein KDI_53110 [Dictyobacter arantiisoli]
MNAIEQIPQVQTSLRSKWQYYLLDALIAALGSLFITGIIYYWHLYPLVKDVVIVQLLWVIILATMCSRYAAIIGTIVTFLSFDYLLVPPLYTLRIVDPVQWVNLGLFLIIALFTSQLAGSIRHNAEVARKNQQELRILYEVMRVCAATDDLEEQLDIIALSTVRVFSSLGVRQCAIFTPDQDNTFKVRADAPIHINEFEPTMCELQAVQAAFTHNTRVVVADEKVPHSLLYLIPLKIGSHVSCVLSLHIHDGVAWLANEDKLQAELEKDSEEAQFFWTFIDQVRSILERSFLHQQLAA